MLKIMAIELGGYGKMKTHTPQRQDVEQEQIDAVLSSLCDKSIEAFIPGGRANDQAQIKDIIESTDVSSEEAAISFGSDAAKELWKAPNTPHANSAMARIQNLSKDIQNSMDDVDMGEEDCEFDQVLAKAMKTSDTIREKFMASVLGILPNATEKKAKIRQERREKRKIIEKRMRDIVLNNKQAIQKLGIYRIELPTLSKMLLQRHEDNKNVLAALRIHLAAGKAILRQFENDEGALKVSLPDGDFKNRKDFMSIFATRLIVLEREYGLAISNEVQFKQSEGMLENLKEALDSILDAEMPFIKNRLQIAGDALKLLEMNDRYDSHLEHLEDMQRDASAHLKALKGSGFKDNENAKQAGYVALEKKQKKLGALTEELVSQRQRIGNFAKALKTKTTNNSIEEVRDLQNNYGHRSGSPEIVTKATSYVKPI